MPKSPVPRPVYFCGVLLHQIQILRLCIVQYNTMTATTTVEHTTSFVVLRISGRAYTGLIHKYGWDTVTILYEDNVSMKRLKEILDRTSEVGKIFFSSSLLANTHHMSSVLWQTCMQNYFSFQALKIEFRLVVKQLMQTEENGYRDVIFLHCS